MPKKTTPTQKAAPVPEEQWSMPVTFSPSGALVSLRDFTQSRVPALSLSQLTPEQRVELTARRIELQPRFEVAMVGAGTVDLGHRGRARRAAYPPQRRLCPGGTSRRRLGRVRHPTG